VTTAKEQKQDLKPTEPGHLDSGIDEARVAMVLDADDAGWMRAGVRCAGHIIRLFAAHRSILSLSIKTHKDDECDKLAVSGHHGHITAHRSILSLYITTHRDDQCDKLAVSGHHEHITAHHSILSISIISQTKKTVEQLILNNKLLKNQLPIFTFCHSPKFPGHQTIENKSRPQRP